MVPLTYATTFASRIEFARWSRFSERHPLILSQFQSDLLLNVIQMTFHRVKCENHRHEVFMRRDFGMTSAYWLCRFTNRQASLRRCPSLSGSFPALGFSVVWTACFPSRVWPCRSYECGVRGLLLASIHDAARWSTEKREVSAVPGPAVSIALR